MNEGDDPFGSLSRRCQPTSSQEEILRTCLFARESEVFPNIDDDDSTSSEFPVDPTPIVMVSLSESPSPSPPEDFQTPPEDSLPRSSEEQRPQTDAVDAGEDRCSDNNVCSETVAVDEEGCTDGEGAVDLGKDWEDLGFSGMQLTRVIDGGCRVSGADSSSEGGLEKFVVLQRKSMLVCGIPNENVGDNGPSGADEPVPVIVETDCYQDASTEVIDFEIEEIGEILGEDKVPEKLPLRETQVGVVLSEGNGMANNGSACSVTKNIEDLDNFRFVSSNTEEIGESLGEDKVPDKLPLRETQVGIVLSEGNGMSKNGSGGLARKNIEDLDKFRFVSSSGANQSLKRRGIGGQRELPSSISRQANISGGEPAGPGTLAAQNKILKNLLEALKMVSEEVDGGSKEEVDFLETAKRRGMTFPRPRWWPPEGYDD